MNLEIYVILLRSIVFARNTDYLIVLIFLLFYT